MSGAREAILGRISKAISEGGAPARCAREAGANERLRAKTPGILPAGSKVSDKEAVKLFTRKAQAVDTTVSRIDAASDIASAVVEYLNANNLPMALRHGADPLLDEAGWSEEPLLETVAGPSDGSDLVGLSVADGAIAETGTLILTSGPDNPTTLNFLPEHHIVVLPIQRIHGSLEDALRKTAVTASDKADSILPRVINMITGPSRSGDVEQQIVLGAHGPRALHIILVG
ncbi:LutC/YkgG family protein [Notoacmeibacter ruber]|uniref:Lactate utilization protein n=1 Tax=Notoacmeibacter ruber TaxID=2670375 RepID=A0A3L7J946_9HYPH|nr:lactate utilization protein [Notoacmeibacter ruber]RLQ87248.1 lactate utilization protein [Notoacmeibacter ruber]